MLEIAQEIGGIPNVENYMKSNERKNDILQQDRYAKENKGITGVPYFIISCNENIEKTFSGAVETQDICNVLESLHKSS